MSGSSQGLRSAYHSFYFHLIVGFCASVLPDFMPPIPYFIPKSVLYMSSIGYREGAAATRKRAEVPTSRVGINERGAPSTGLPKNTGLRALALRTTIENGVPLSSLGNVLYGLDFTHSAIISLPWCTDKKTEAQRGTITLPKSHSCEITGLRVGPRSGYFLMPPSLTYFPLLPLKSHHRDQ